MIERVKKLITSLSVASLFLVPVMAPVAVHAAADIKGNLCSGADLDVDGTCDDPTGDTAKTTVNNLLTNVINIFSLIVGVVAVIMIIIGGLKYITSGGEASNITGAKNTILYAVIGLVVVALAQFIVKFVLAKVST